jgi:hypothetical protein
VLNFKGSTIVGDEGENPADALQNRIINFYHMANCQTPALYEVQFVWMTTGKVYARGRLRVGSPNEIIATRNARLQHERAGAGAPQAAPYSAATPPAPYQGHVPPTAGAASNDDEVAALREEVRRLREDNGYHKGVLEEVLRGRGALPAQSPQPSPGDDMVERVVARVLGTLGVKTQTVGMGAPPAPPPNLQAVAGEAVTSARALVSAVRDLRALGKSLEGALAEPTAAAVAEVVDTEPDDPLGFQVAGVGDDVKWKDGRPVKIAVDRKTGKIDWTGVALANPVVGEKIMDSLNDLVGGMQKLVRVIAPAAAAAGEQGTTESSAETTTEGAEGQGGGEGWDL